MTTQIEPNLNGHGPKTTTAVPAPNGGVPGQRARPGPDTAVVEPVPTQSVPVRTRPLPVHVLLDEKVRVTASNRPWRVHARGTGYLPYRYMIGEILSVGSQIPLPELEFFNIKFLPLRGEGVTLFLVNVIPFLNLALAGFVGSFLAGEVDERLAAIDVKSADWVVEIDQAGGNEPAAGNRLTPPPGHRRRLSGRSRLCPPDGLPPPGAAPRPSARWSRPRAGRAR